MTTKFVVAGTGWVAAEYFKAIQDHPEGEVYGVVSRDPNRAAGRMRELGVHAHVYGSFEAAVKDAQVDAVVLCSTPDVRPEQAILAAQHGKHLVIEKPLAMDKESLWRMAEAIEQHPVRTVVSFVLRWNPMFTMARSLIADDALGRIFLAQVDYWHHVGPQYPQYRWSSRKALGGSSMLSAGCHAVDALRYFAGEVEEVTAYSCRTWADSDYEFDPNVIAVLRLKNGGIGKVSSSLECKTPYKFNVHLLGEKGTLVDNHLYTHKLPGQTDYATIPTVLPESGDVEHHPFKHEINDFVQAIRSGSSTRCDFFDAFKTMETCFAIDESAALGTSMSLPLARG